MKHGYRRYSAAPGDKCTLCEGAFTGAEAAYVSNATNKIFCGPCCPDLSVSSKPIPADVEAALEEQYVAKPKKPKITCLECKHYAVLVTTAGDLPGQCQEGTGVDVPYSAAHLVTCKLAEHKGLSVEDAADAAGATADHIQLNRLQWSPFPKVDIYWNSEYKSAFTVISGKGTPPPSSVYVDSVRADVQCETCKKETRIHVHADGKIFCSNLCKVINIGVQDAGETAFIHPSQQ